ncbi:unnamed protein product [Closterium sp. NIES-53]
MWAGQWPIVIRQLAAAARKRMAAAAVTIKSHNSSSSSIGIGASTAATTSQGSQSPSAFSSPSHPSPSQPTSTHHSPSPSSSPSPTPVHGPSTSPSPIPPSFLRIRFTAVDPPFGHPYGTGPKLPAAFLQAELARVAQECGVSLSFSRVEAAPETLRAAAIGVERGECVLVNVAGRLACVADSTVLRHSPKDTAIKWDSNQQQPFFLSRFRDALLFFHNIFASHHALASRFSPSLQHKLFPSLQHSPHLLTAFSPCTAPLTLPCPPPSPLPSGDHAAKPKGSRSSRVGLQPTAALLPASLQRRSPLLPQHLLLPPRPRLALLPCPPTHSPSPSTLLTADCCFHPPPSPSLPPLSQAIMQLDLKVVALVEWDSNQQHPFFLSRFRDALLFFHNIFASHHALASRLSPSLQRNPRLLTLFSRSLSPRPFPPPLPPPFLQAIMQLDPKVVALVEWDSNQQQPFFLSRFRDALLFFHNIFTSHDALASRFSFGRRGFEEFVLAREMVNLVACEGMQRLVRAERLDQMHARMGRLGVAARPFSKRSMWGLRELIAPYPKGFAVERHPAGGVRLMWNGQSILGASAWTPGGGDERRMDR